MAHGGLGLEVVGVLAVALLAGGQAVVAGGGLVVFCGGAGVDVDVAQLLAGAACAGERDEVGGVLVAERVQGLVRLAQLDGAVGGQVAALGVAGDEVAAGEQCLGAGVVARGEVDLRQPEDVLVVACAGLLVIMYVYMYVYIQ
jgi:hypothetical protein